MTEHGLIPTNNTTDAHRITRLRGELRDTISHVDHLIQYAPDYEFRSVLNGIKERSQAALDATREEGWRP